MARQSRLDLYRFEIMEKLDLGWTQKRVVMWLYDEKGFKCSIMNLSKWLKNRTSNPMTMELTYGQAKKLEKQQKGVLKKAEKTISIIDSLAEDFWKKWNENKDKIEPRSWEGMAQQMIKLLELRAKIIGEIQSGTAGIVIMFGKDDARDKHFIEFTRTELEKANIKWDEFMNRFAVWEKKKYPKVHIKDEYEGDVIDAESRDDPSEA